MTPPLLSRYCGSKIRRGGSGLGLSIVETIASSHGGTASVAAAATGGADAWLTVPKQKAPFPT